MVALLLFAATPTAAHLLNMTRVEVALDPETGSVQGEMAIDLTVALGGPERYFEAAHAGFGPSSAVLAPVIEDLAAAIVLAVDGQRLPVEVVRITLPDLPRRRFTEAFAAPMGALAFRASIPSDAAGAEAQLTLAPTFPFPEPLSVTLAHARSGRTMTRWLVPGQPSPSFPLTPAVAPLSVEQTAAVPVPAAGDIALQFGLYGFRHVVPRGWDHVLFVGALALGAATLGRLVLLVSLFTVAHSLTIALTALGLIAPPVAAVEVLIALSIVAVAAGNAFGGGRAGDARVPLVFAFGLVHGMGFAQAMSEVSLTGIPFIGALLAFNFGVELGQLLVVALVLPALLVLRAQPELRRPVVLPASAAMALVAGVWVVERLAAALPAS